MRVLGIDPGIRNTGWGVVEMASGRLRHIANGVIRPDPAMPDAQRLQAIADGLDSAITTHKPDRAAIEAIFVARSAAAALKLGMARGVAMMQCGGAGLAVDEIAARQVKKAVVGTGSADKAQVAAMITRLLGITAVNGDAADALAIAIAAGHGDGLAARGDTGAAKVTSAGSTSAGSTSAGSTSAGSTSAGDGLGAAIEAALARDAAADRASGGGSGGGRR
ncbi:MAG: crossover junction endodeoxyribonuclease RuvC [Pseudomonadota bacterium]|nr:crossover junction endodeoxyribonuclease RuvC [Pseudomonadota bacterium]